MWNRYTSKKRPARPRSQRWLMVVLAGSLIPALGVAEEPHEPTRTILKSALYTVPPGHVLTATVADVGAGTAASRVAIEFLDRAGQRRAFTSARFSPERPARLRLPIPAGTVFDMLRVVVTLEIADGGQPIALLEDLDVDSFRVDTKPPCAPPSVGGSAEGNCGGWVMNRLTLDQAPWPN